MIYNYEDYNILNESLINEEFNFNDIKTKLMNLKNKNKALDYLIDKFNSIHNLTHKLHISKMILLLYMLTLSNPISTNLSATQLDNSSRKLSNFKTLTKETLDEEIKRIADYHKTEADKEESIKKNKYIWNTKLEVYSNPTTLRLSEKGKENIKEHEQLRLDAYTIGDGMITIGYGHSEPIKKSKFKKGDIITKQQAVKMFEHDVYDKAKNVRSMFKEWEIKNNRKILITQSMFDAIVSMAYNIGITSFRNTDFIEYLEKGDLKTAANVIKSTKIHDKFPGLIDRRQFEYDLFMNDLNNFYKKHQD